MTIGPQKNNTAYSTPLANRAHGLHDRKQPISVGDFHRQKKLALEALLTDPALGNKLPELKKFVTDYTSEYALTFKGATPNTRQRLPLFQQASEQVFLLYQAKLNALRKNPNTSIVDLSDLMNDFIRDFPEGDKSLIHYQDKETYKLFQNQLLLALNAKIHLNGNGDYTRSKSGLCAESLLLQNLAKLPIPLDAKADDQKELIRSSQQNSYRSFVQELVARTTRYIERNKVHSDLASMTMPLSALSYLNVMSFSKTNGHGIYMTTTNPVVDPFVRACVQKILSNQKSCLPEALVRAIHSIILLSREQNNFKTYLQDGEVASLLCIVKNMKFDLNNQEHKKLATQLYQIRNIYPNAFPNELSTAIEPFVRTMQQDTHSSQFEDIISDELKEATTELQTRYPGLIDKKYFNTQNPICADLGLESDITYENGSVLTCVQVDGNKFHQYPGTKENNQRTKLRDFSFRSQQWKVVIFSDSEHGKEHAYEQLRKAVVIPTFEMLTQKNIVAIAEAKSSLNNVKQTLSSIGGSGAKAELQALNKQANTLLAMPATISQMKLSTESLLLQVEHAIKDANVKLSALTNQLEQFDSKTAQELTHISVILGELETLKSHCTHAGQQYQLDFEAAQCNLEKLKKEEQIALIEHKNIEAQLAAAEQLEAEHSAKITAIETALQAKAQRQPVELAYAHLNRNQLKELQEQLNSPLGTLQIAHKKQVSALKKSSAKLGEFNNLIVKNNKKIAELSQTIASNGQQKAILDEQIQQLENALRSPIAGSQLLRDYEGLLADVTALKGQHEKLMAQLTELKDKVSEAITINTSKLNTQAAVFVPRTFTPASCENEPEAVLEEPYLVQGYYAPDGCYYPHSGYYQQPEYLPARQAHPASGYTPMYQYHGMQEQRLQEQRVQRQLENQQRVNSSRLNK